jgi:hypothetical protein
VFSGKKPYGDWGIEEMLREILLGQYTSIDAVPRLDMGNIFLFSRAALFYGLFLQVILEQAMFSTNRKLRASPTILKR